MGQAGGSTDGSSGWDPGVVMMDQMMKIVVMMMKRDDEEMTRGY